MESKMKLLDICTLQEFSPTQFNVLLNKVVKAKCVKMGWKKQDRIAVYESGKGFFIEKIEDKK